MNTVQPTTTIGGYEYSWDILFVKEEKKVTRELVKGFVPSVCSKSILKKKSHFLFTVTVRMCENMERTTNLSVKPKAMKL
jgi:hypothetical protein